VGQGRQIRRHQAGVMTVVRARHARRSDSFVR
jgi:hypothetical protein